MKQSLAAGQSPGEGQQASGSQQKGADTNRGQAASDYGMGTSASDDPSAAAPNEPGNKENRQGDVGRKEADATDYTPLYTPEEFEHGFGEDAQLKGQVNPNQQPQDVQEVRSLPETQEALTSYADVVSAYTQGEEQAIEREQVPVEYQDLVRLYFTQLKQAAKGEDKGEASKDEGDSAKKDTKPAKDKGKK